MRPSSGRIVSLLYQPESMRFRGLTVMTNTPPRGAQSSPGGMQGITLMEPILAKAGTQAGTRSGGHPPHQRSRGQGAVRAGDSAGKRAYATSAFIKEALDRGAEKFDWNERIARNPKRSGTKVRGVGVSMSCYVGGSIGYDALTLIKPDGRICFQSGIGNLGTESVIDVHRVTAEMLGVPWEKCDVCWGTNAKNLAWSCVSGGSQTTHAMTRAAHAVGEEAKVASAGNRRQEPGW